MVGGVGAMNPTNRNNIMETYEQWKRRKGIK